MDNSATNTETAAAAVAAAAAAAAAAAVVNLPLDKRVSVDSDKEETGSDEANEALRAIVEQTIPQPPPPVEQSFATLEDAKSYIAEYMVHTGTKLVIFRSNKQRGTINYRCQHGGKPSVGNKQGPCSMAAGGVGYMKRGEKRRKIGVIDPAVASSSSHLAETASDSSVSLDPGKTSGSGGGSGDKLTCGFKVFVKFDRYDNLYHLTVPHAFHSHTTDGFTATDSKEKQSDALEVVLELVHRHNIYDAENIKSILALRFPKVAFDSRALQSEIDFSIAHLGEQAVSEAAKTIDAKHDDTFASVAAQASAQASAQGDVELSEMFQNLNSVVKFVYRIVSNANIRDFSSVKFLVMDKFKDQTISDEKIKDHIEFCLRLKNHVENLSNGLQERPSEKTSSNQQDSEASMKQALLEAAAAAAAASTAQNQSINDTDAVLNATLADNIDPEISNAIAANALLNNADETAKPDPNGFNDFQSQFRSSVLSQAIALSSLGHHQMANSMIDNYKEQRSFTGLSNAARFQALSNSISNTINNSYFSKSPETTPDSNQGPAPPQEQVFASMEEAREYLKKYMVESKVGLVIYKSGKNRGYALYRCERGGVPEENIIKRRSSTRENVAKDSEGKQLKKRNRQSKKLDCPFKVHIKLDKKTQTYRLTVPSEEHNHPIVATDLKDHPILRKRGPEHLKFLAELYMSGVKKPQFLKKRIMERFPGLYIIDKDIYNDIRKVKALLATQLRMVDSNNYSTPENYSQLAETIANRANDVKSTPKLES